MRAVGLLQASGGASRAETALKQPFAVCVEAILNVSLVDRLVQLCGQLASPVPGQNFELSQQTLITIIFVFEQGMTRLVK